MLQRPVATQIQVYLGKKAEFERRRRKIRLSFDKLYSLLASNFSLYDIAKVAGVSRTRVHEIYDQYFRELFAINGLERLRQRELLKRDEAANQVAKIVGTDPLLKAIKASAARANPKRVVEPIILKRSDEPGKCYRHKAVLIDTDHVEAVHYVRNARRIRRRGITYGTTTLYRSQLQTTKWTIFVLDVPQFRRRVIRTRSSRLIEDLFPGKQRRVSVYIPLDAQPENPRYDFLADEDNWG
jgi:AraC-like DNA-binding protein